MNDLFHPILLAQGAVDGNLFLAPMAGYTDKAFRSIAREWGACLTFTEMVSAEAVRRGNRKTILLAQPAPGEEAFAVQIFTGDAAAAAAAVAALAPFSPRLFDLNCGCSVPKILKTGAGARLLLEPRIIGMIVKAMAAESPIPVSVKLRLGWDADSLTYLEAAEEAAAAGAALVTLHPRTRAQGFGGRADWTHIKTLKERLRLPVIASGDLFTPEDALHVISLTGCDGVMFARGAVGNPFIFEDTRNLLSGRRPTGSRPAEIRLRVALRHLALLSEEKPEPLACREMRKHFARYVAGLEHAAALRRTANIAASRRDYEIIVERFLSGTLTE